MIWKKTIYQVTDNDIYIDIRTMAPSRLKVSQLRNQICPRDHKVQPPKAMSSQHLPPTEDLEDPPLHQLHSDIPHFILLLAKNVANALTASLASVCGVSNLSVSPPPCQ